MDKYIGLYRGIVCDVNDPEKRGRVRCLIPDVLGANVASAWCEPCANFAFNGGGFISVPMMGDTIWIQFEKGEPNKPVWMGNWWSKFMTPLGAGYNLGSSVFSYGGSIITFSGGTINVVGDIKATGSVHGSNI